ncbi:MAG: SMC-Scp complex subunit ScpB [Planctomycetota bacterium]|jgi:segregation and condensation protein B
MTDGVSEEKINDEVPGNMNEDGLESGEDVELDSPDSPEPAAEEVPEEMEGAEPTVESVTEAVLFASDEPLTAERLAGIVGAGKAKDIRKCIGNLNDKYDAGGFAFRVEQIAGGYQMMTLGRYNHWLSKLLRVRTDTKLSQPALETLAIIAYKQPVIRADVEAIRGVAAGEMVRGLMYKGLVKIVGRAEVLGRPMLYGTTKKFLDIFGLASIRELPKVEELKKPDQ